MCISSADELAARRAAVAAVAAMAQACPYCGRSLAGHGGTYAKDAPVVEKQQPIADDEPPPSNWRKLPPLL